ncbi:HlyD family efflux transporter periplasmic adaptor subunit [Caulobacter sp. 602-2]|uniref:HlyD family efflux transporter periplasmic adaptor subunit n=1 Tax=Caulobacter sp. 602-2 TaxID=2710887 RepID=A0A6G4R2Y6_9CAUL|nr:HlyD family efflux transporter periplasmic adaptor subunit [Caulobacter sp. 602-2]NGM52087.1 HlyD family efflux transporter periplasmic adaptor subunit [Caulobacter sp. 602-2]
MPALFRRRRFWLISVGALAILGGGVWYSGQAKAKKVEAAKVAAATPATPYGAVADGKADVEGGVISVAARRQGIVSEVYVQEGDTVRKGQPLAKQEDDDVRLAAETAAANLAQARAQIRVLEVRKATAQREFTRLQGLTASNFVAGQRLDQARDAIAGADAELEAQRAMVATFAAQLNQARYNQELTVIRAPADGRIARRYANPGSGASTLNVTSMFDLEPATARIVRAEISESAIPFVAIGQSVEIIPEADQKKTYTGKVLRRAAVFGARKLQSDDPSERTDARVVEVVVSADDTPFLIGQRVLVKFMKPGQVAGAKRTGPQAADPPKT